MTPGNFAMRDNLMGGILAFGIATPIVFVCCGGGAAILAAVFGGIGAWLSGLGGIFTAFVAAVAFLFLREARRAAMRPTTPENPQHRKNAT